MCKLFDEWSTEIEAYCKANGLDFEKLKKQSKCWNKTSINFGHPDPEKGKTGLLDDTPMPLVLHIERNIDGKLEFMQTEFTQKFLS